MEARSERVRVACNVSRTFGVDSPCSDRCLSTEISASELRREFVKSALLAGMETRREGEGDPTTNGGMQNGCSVRIRTRRMQVFWHVWRRFGMLSRFLSTKISPSELSQKFVKSALLVGCPPPPLPPRPSKKNKSTVGRHARECLTPTLFFFPKWKPVLTATFI